MPEVVHGRPLSAVVLTMRSLAGASRRTLLNYCFMVHAVLSGFVGVAALVFPHLVGVFFGEEVRECE